MGIKFKCSSCDFQLNVKTKLAGMRGICPNCKAKVKIPAAPKEAPAEKAEDAKTDKLAASKVAARKSTSAKPAAKQAASQKSAVAKPVEAQATGSAVKQDAEPVAEAVKPTTSAQAANRSGKPPRKPPVDTSQNVEIFQPSNSAASTASVSSVPGEIETSSAQPEGQAPVVQEAPIKPAVLAESSGDSTAAMDPLQEVPDAVWYVRPPGGGQFGPASADLMRQWITEGRIGAHSLVWRDGWADWLVAQNVFVELGASPNAAAPAPAANDQAPQWNENLAADSGLSPSNANQKKMDYYRAKKKKATCGIAVIFVGIMIIAALAVLLAIVLSQS